MARAVLRSGSIPKADDDRDGRMLAALSDPAGRAYSMRQWGYMLAFLLVPRSLPWMELRLIGRKDIMAVDHVVFRLYGFSFLVFLALFATVLAGSGVTASWLCVLLLAVVPVAHLFQHLRLGYRLGVGRRSGGRAC